MLSTQLPRKLPRLIATSISPLRILDAMNSLEPTLWIPQPQFCRGPSATCPPQSYLSYRQIGNGPASRIAASLCCRSHDRGGVDGLWCLFDNSLDGRCRSARHPPKEGQAPGYQFGAGALFHLGGRGHLRFCLGMEKTDKTTQERFVLRFSSSSFSFSSFSFSFFSSCRVIRGEARRYYDMKLNTNTLTSLTSGASSAGLASAGVSVTIAGSVTATAVSLISMLVENNKAIKRERTRQVPRGLQELGRGPPPREHPWQAPQMKRTAIGDETIRPRTREITHLRVLFSPLAGSWESRSFSLTWPCP